MCGPIARPDTRSEWLRRVCRPCPCERLLQQRQYIRYLIFDFHCFVRRARHVIGFVPYVPTENALVFRKMGDDTFHVALQTWILCAVLKHMLTGALYPTRIMHVRFGVPLLASYRKWIPAGIEENKQRPDAMLVGQPQKVFDSGNKARRILLIR